MKSLGQGPVRGFSGQSLVKTKYRAHFQSPSDWLAYSAVILILV